MIRYDDLDDDDFVWLKIYKFLMYLWGNIKLDQIKWKLEQKKI